MSHTPTEAMSADLEKLLAEATPGPWSAEFDKRTWGWADVVADRFHVGWPTRATDLSHRDYVARTANARLIAQAPDLARRVLAAEKLAEAAREFERRCAAGEIRSKRSRAAFAEALAEWEALK